MPAFAGMTASNRVHADAVAEQRAAGLAPARVHRNHGDVELVVLVQAEAADQLVGDRRLARAAGAGYAEDGHVMPADAGIQFWIPAFAGMTKELVVESTGLDQRDHARQRAPVAGLELEQQR